MKFDHLHERLTEVKLTSRFTAYVMELPDSTYAEARSDWVVSDITKEKRRMLTPHSTLSNPESRDDRDWYRTRLRRELDRAWSP